jgi:hypothetical protein
LGRKTHVLCFCAAKVQIICEIPTMIYEIFCIFAGKL